VAPVPLPNMTPAQLLAVATEVSERFPDAELVKNGVGNLAGFVNGAYVAWLDLRTGEVASALADGD
jgi:hypothetical protein